MTDEERKEKNRLKVAKWRAANPEANKANYRVSNNRRKLLNPIREKSWIDAAREKTRRKVAKWRKSNPEKAKLHNKKRKEITINQRINLRIKEKNRHLDPVISMKRRIRIRLNHAYKSSGLKKNTKTEKMLGCSFRKFKQHIEKQFIDGMNWDNRSEWHLDHIIPLSCATTIEGLEKLSHYTNIRPLWAKDNMAKSDDLVLH